MTRKLISLIILTLMAAGVIYSLHELIALAIAHWQAPSLHGDSFTFVIRNQDSSLTDWIISQHNEHRIIPAKLTSIIETDFFRIPPGQSGIFQNLALILACIGQWCWVCQHLLKRSYLRLSTALAGSLILLNPWQFENFNWEFQTPWFLINALVLTCTLLLSKSSTGSFKKHRILLLSLILPWVAIGSTGQGLALAIAFIACAWINSGRLGALVSGSTGLAILTFYKILPYSKPSAHPDLSFQLNYFLKSWLGGIWQGLALLFVGLVITTAIVSRGQIPPRSTWPAALMPGLFSLIFAGMVTLSRSGFGLDSANASRYVTHSLMLGLSALLVLALVDDQNHQYWPRLPLLGSCLVLITTFGSFPQILSANGITYQEAWKRVKVGPEQKRKGLACHARQTIFEDKNIHLTEKCRGIFPDQAVINRYFQGNWPVQPMGWHKQLLEEASIFRTGTIVHKINYQSLKPAALKLQGWGFLKEAPDQELYLLARYNNSKQIAIPIKQKSKDVKQFYRLSNKRVGFNTAIPRSYKGNPLRSVRIGTPTQSVQIWQDPSADG